MAFDIALYSLPPRRFKALTSQNEWEDRKMFGNPDEPELCLPYPQPPTLDERDCEWTIGELCAALSAERAANAALLALCYRLAAELGGRHDPGSQR